MILSILYCDENVQYILVLSPGWPKRQYFETRVTVGWQNYTKIVKYGLKYVILAKFDELFEDGDFIKEMM